MRGLQCRGCGRVWGWHPRLEPSRVSRAVLGACCGCGEGMGCGVVTTDVKGSTRLASRICLLPCSGLLAFWNSCTVLCAGHQHCHSWWHCPAGMGTWEVWPSQTGVHFQNTAREPTTVSGGMSVGEGPRLCFGHDHACPVLLFPGVEIMDGNKGMLWQTDLLLAPPVRAEPVLGPEQCCGEPAATSAQAAVAAASTERRRDPWELHPCLLTVCV